MKYIMKVFHLITAISLMLWSGALYAKNNDNVAYQDRQVRFTVITDGVVRLEWEPRGRFEDLPSFVASERNYPEVEFKISETRSHVTITTSKMTLSYKKGSGKFTENNMKIEAADKVENLDSNDEDIAVTVFPGGNGTFTLYEDAGNDKNYSTEYATTAISNTWNGKTQKITIAARKGSYAGMPKERDFKVKVLASKDPVSVKINSKEV